MSAEERKRGRRGEGDRAGKRSSIRGKITPWLLRGAKLLELLLFPSFCRLCFRLLEKPGERVVCAQCWESVPGPPSSYCLRCGRFFAGGGGPHLCLSCHQEEGPLSLHRSCARYEGVIREIILLCKYGGFKVLGQDLGRFALRMLKKEEALWSGIEVIVPVPLHPKRERRRGFNQSLEIGQEIGRAMGLEVAPRALVKAKDTLPQASLEAEARRENVRGVYTLGREEKIKGKVVLLIDDVLTTGSTIEECGRILRKGGAKEVRALTIAQA